MVLLEIILIGYFVYVVAYTTAFSIAALFYRSPVCRPHGIYFNYCVFIPAYKEDAVIVETAYHALHQSYPPANFHVVVIADGLREDTLEKLSLLGVCTIPVSFHVSTKVKSLVRAMETIGDSFDFALILDADNIIEYNFLRKINDLQQTRRLPAVQCQRVAKNQNNHLAFLDGLSEAINNRIFREGATALGLSSSISGSGVVVDYKLLKDKLQRLQSVGGFDRELELHLLMSKVKVYYYRNAFVLDEKVSDNRVFQNQRKRWIASQYHYLAKYFSDGVRALGQGNFSFFNSAVLRNIQLPRLINLGLLVLLVFALVPIKEHLTLSYRWWPFLLTVDVAAIMLAIPKSFYSARLIRSLLSIPGLFLRMMILLFRLKGANKVFIHTPHSVKTHNS